MPTTILEDLSPEAVLPAMDANLAEYCLQYGRLPGAVAHGDNPVRWFVTGVLNEAFNGVIQAWLEPDDVDITVERLLAEFRRRGVPARWQIGPTSQPATLGSSLLAHGFSHATDMAGMALDLRAMSDAIPLPADLSIESVIDSDGLQAWIQAWGSEATDLAKQCWWDAFSQLGLSSSEPWRYYLGRWNGVPVATVKLFYSAGVVCVHHVATIPNFRRRGIGTAIVAYALRAARDRGYWIAVLTASPAGYGSYRNLGFQPYCTVQRFVVGQLC